MTIYVSDIKVNEVNGKTVNLGKRTTWNIGQPDPPLDVDEKRRMTKTISQRDTISQKSSRKLKTRVFVLYTKPTKAGGSHTVLNYKLTVYEIHETLPDSATSDGATDKATINFMKVVGGQVDEQHEVHMSVKLARRHWASHIKNGWAPLPEKRWPKWLLAHGRGKE